MASAPGERAIIAVSVLGVATIAFFGVRAYNKNKAEREARKEGKELDNQVTDDIKNTGKPATTNQTNYKLYAERLYKALNVWDPSAVPVYQVFAQMNNDRDILELIKAFGMKLDSSNGIDDDIMSNLATFIAKLEPEEIRALNMMLAKKAVKYRF